MISNMQSFGPRGKGRSSHNKEKACKLEGAIGPARSNRLTAKLRRGTTINRRNNNPKPRGKEQSRDTKREQMAVTPTFKKARMDQKK